MRFAKLPVVFFLAVLFFSIHNISHAQIIGTNIVNENDIDFKLEPEFPEPHERVTLTIQSFVIDLDKSYIAWSVDGKDITKGYGSKMLQFTAKDVGQQTRVKVIIEGNERPLEKTFVFEPSTLDMLWEATNVYAPPFYKGKKLPIFESLVKVAAIPDVRTSNGVPSKDSDIIYTWKHELKVVQDQSGYGKNGLLVKKNRLQSEETIDVGIRSRDGAAHMEKRLRIPTFLPKVVITPLPFMGNPSEKNTFNIQGGEVSLVANPYFFTAQKRSDVPYSWVVGTQAVTNEKTSAIRIKKSADATSANVSAKVESPTNFFESGTGAITVNFK